MTRHARIAHTHMEWLGINRAIHPGVIEINKEKRETSTEENSEVERRNREIFNTCDCSS